MTVVGTGERQLVVHLNAPGWRAELEVAQPPTGTWRRVDFDVPLNGGRNPHREPLTAEVRYTTAENRLGDGWEKWFVKVYRCRSFGEAEALRRYLGQQASYIRGANSALSTDRVSPVDPPWSVVPVHIVRCDGGQEIVGPVQTELAASPSAMASRIMTALPSWLTDSPPAPERYLLAVSPFMDDLHWEEHQGWPATEHLQDFTAMAAGLDALHQQDTVHCDIKPANVCRYNTHHVSGYVLIDTDSVTPVYPPPRSLRPTKPYHYKAITDWFENPQLRHLGVDAAILRAHDRFGFAVVVLTALAGKGWVDRVLLRAPEQLTGYHSGADWRTADDRRLVIAALRAHWPDRPDRQWQPLIQTLAEPFGPEIELDSWSSAAWIQRVLRAESACVIEEAKPKLFPTADPVAYAADLEGIRTTALAVPSIRPELMRGRGYGAIEQTANDVALRAAFVRAAGSAAAVAIVIFILLYSVFG
ncbi:hypothetical protein ACFPIJ_61855 [Dactylosporangium cerinum]|uniref:Protein kinase domain-containing protein n=1 Tax=Dactylosporangium cerinum TaxID=1434730 RepID=A0ABV9WIB2_9ACTN